MHTETISGNLCVGNPDLAGNDGSPFQVKMKKRPNVRLLPLEQAYAKPRKTLDACQEELHI